MVEVTRGGGSGGTKPGGGIERLRGCCMFGTTIEDEQIPDRMFRLDQRIESVQFKTWQVLKDGSYDMGSS